MKAKAINLKRRLIQSSLCLFALVMIAFYPLAALSANTAPAPSSSMASLAVNAVGVDVNPKKGQCDLKMSLYARKDGVEIGYDLENCF